MMSVKAILASVVIVVVSVAADFDLTILHTNDVHARLEEADINGGPCTAAQQEAQNCFGGASRIRTMVKQKRIKYPDQVLLLDAGDQFQGTLWFYVFGGILSAQFMNLIGYDAMAIGNHEFDSGIEGLAPFAGNLTFPLLSSNINVSNTPALKDIVKKSTVLVVRGQRVGVVGYTTTETPYISSPETVTFAAELEAIQSEINSLNAMGVNMIIALGHSGFVVDIDLAARLKYVDIVVGGHTNTFLYNGTAPSNEVPLGVYPTVVQNLHSGKNVLVVQDYAFGKYLGELHVTFDDAGEIIKWSGNPILLDKSVAKDSEAEALIQQYTPELDKMKTTVIGESYVDLMADRILCRTTECSLGNFVADSVVNQNLRQSGNDSWTDVGIAVVNAGSLRASIPKGLITTEKVVFVQPFRNTVDMVEVLGQTLVEILEFGASKWTQNPNEAFGGFLQVSGLQITYDIRRAVGQRVVKVLAVCTKCLVPKLEPLDPTKIYRILMSSFIINGGDGYSMLPAKIHKIVPIGYLDTDILLGFVKKYSPLTTSLHNRIRHLQDITGSLLCSASGAGKLLPLSLIAVIIQLVTLWTMLC